MSPNTLRCPTFSGLRPNLLRASPVSDVISDAICEAIGVRGLVSRVVEGEGLCGYFLLQTNEVAALFIKVIESEYELELRDTNAIAESLGLMAVESIPKHEGRIGSVAVFAYPYVDGRPANADSEDMNLVGQALARLHLALKEFSGAATVKQKAFNWYGHLDKVITAAGVQKDLGIPEKAIKALATGKLIMEEVQECVSPQALHGDLNFGNILVRNDDSEAVILDFENVCYSYGDITWDLAQVLERFCFPPGIDDKSQRELARSLLQGYYAFGGVTLPDPDWFFKSLRLRNRLCLAVLAVESDYSQAVWDSEVKKFMGLIEDISRKSNIIKSLYDK